MKTLVTNDDGIDSPGIQALAEAMSRVGEVLIVDKPISVLIEEESRPQGS